MIPKEKEVAVTRALQEAFGVDQFEDSQVMTAGLSSALVYRIVVKGNPYLLRIIIRTDAMGDPTREFTCMKTAAEAGLAPHVWYTSTVDRISITDFVEAKPFPEDVIPRMARTLRKLHSLPHFLKIVNYFDTVDGIAQKFKLAKALPDNRTEELVRLYDRVANAYPRNGNELVACHNDLKPQNILFDGNQIWLIDWEAAFLNDRYIDLAVASNFFVRDEVHEKVYLKEYFGEEPGEYRRARFYLARQFIHMFYVMYFMMISVTPGVSVDPDINVPDFYEFHQHIISGKVDLADTEAKKQYAKVHLKQVLQNTRTKRFEDAMAQVAVSYSHC